MQTKEKYDLKVGHLSVFTTGYYQGAELGSLYKVFEIESFGDSFGRICELLQQRKGDVVVEFKEEPDAPMTKIGVATEIWRTGNWFVKVLVDEW